MNKKKIKIKLSTILTVICCALIAVFCWLYVKYLESTPFLAYLRSSLWS